MSSLLHQNIISILGLANATDGVKNTVMSRLVELVEKRILVAIIDRLTSEQQEDFLRIMDRGTEEERSVFLHKHVPDLPKMVDQEVIKVKQDAHQFLNSLAASAA